jgi:hypothetical protein
MVWERVGESNFLTRRDQPSIDPELLVRILKKSS